MITIKTKEENKYYITKRKYHYRSETDRSINKIN